MIKSFFIFSVLTFFVSCTPDNVSEQLKTGMCVEEIDLRYTAGHKNEIYKIVDMGPRSLKINHWHLNSWIFLGEKPKNYFDNTKKFSYQKITCPDSNQSTSLKDRVKDINISK